MSFLPGGLREIVPESEYELVDRTFQAGDYCKRSLDDVRSGVVVSTHAQARLVHAISSEPVKGWRDAKDLRHATTVNAGDYVAYDDWIGQVRNSHVLQSRSKAYSVLRSSRYASIAMHSVSSFTPAAFRRTCHLSIRHPYSDAGDKLASHNRGQRTRMSCHISSRSVESSRNLLRISCPIPSLFTVFTMCVKALQFQQ